MFVHKKHLSRRTVLKGRGRGARAAVPRRDGAGAHGAGAHRRGGEKRLACIYIPHGVILDQWTPATAGADFEFKPILKPLEPFRQRGHARQQPAAARARLRHQPRRRAVVVAHRRAAEAHRGSRLRARRHARPGGGAGDRPGDDAAVARARHRGLHRPDRRLLAGLQLRVHEHAQLEERDHAAADGDQPAAGVRAPVRRRHHARGAAWRGSRPTRASSISSRAISSSSPASIGARDKARLDEYTRARARDRAPRAAGRAPDRLADRRARSAGGRAGGVRGARHADVRLHGDRVRGRPDARERVHADARAEPADLPEHRRHRAAPHDLAPRQQAGLRSRRTPR